MAVSKRGPNTPSGKEKSSKNAVSHGLRSTQIVTPNEVIVYDNFLNELIDFYKPEGPIERLQLERIATCKAKLKSLYDLEQAKQELLLQEHDAGSNKYIDKMTHLDPLVRGMLKESLMLKELVLPCDLNAELLADIVSEIDKFNGELSSDKDLKKYFPALTAYLDAIKSDATELHVRLMAVYEKLKRVIEDGEDYSEGLKALAVAINQSQDSRSSATPEALALERELDQYQEQARKKRGDKFTVQINMGLGKFPDQAKLKLVFASFRTILHAYQSCHQSIGEVQSSLALHKRTLTLPLDEADLLMRYQTSWERRLSTLIGEFMQLQRSRLLNG